MTSASLFLPMLGEAVISLGGNRLRTFLAMLGIIIGVASLVVMLAVGSGSRSVIEKSINALGTNQLIITPGSVITKGLRGGDISQFTMQDVTAIGLLPSVLYAAPSTFPRNFPGTFEKLNWDTPVVATTSDYILIRNWEFTSGENFTGADIQQSKRVAIIGSTVAEKLFGDSDPLGRVFNLNHIPFSIIGLLKSKGQSMDGRDQDNTVFVPFGAGKIYLWGNDVTTSMVQLIYAQAISAEAMEPATDEITQLLRQRSKLRETDADNFTIRNLTAIKQVAADTNRAFTLLLQAIASISLLVGSIGIMNIMLVTVTERTREIGIRKAIGATENQILLQFLLEAVMLSFAGSLLGLIIGFGAGFGAAHWASLPVEFTLWPVFLSLIMAAGIGVLSGLYPAWKAAKMQPIDALRMVGG